MEVKLTQKVKANGVDTKPSKKQRIWGLLVMINGRAFSDVLLCLVMGDYLLWRWVFFIFPRVSSCTSLMKTWQGCLQLCRQKMKATRKNVAQPWFCAKGLSFMRLSGRSLTVGQLCCSGPMPWIMASRHWLSFSLKYCLDLEGTGSHSERSRDLDEF